MKNLIQKIAVPLLAVGLIAGGVQQANAATKTYTATLSSIKTDIDTALDVQQFNLSLGTLQSVTISFVANATTTITVTNNASTQSTGKVQTEVLYYLNDGGKNLLTANGDSATAKNPNNGYDATVDLLTAKQSYDLAANSGASTLVSKSTTGTGGASYTDSLILSEFTGSGNISLSLATYTTTALFADAGNTSAEQSTYTDGTVTVTYTYEPAAVPEPSTWAMIVGGVGMLVVGQRLRRRSA